MRLIPETCENQEDVLAFCNCISGEAEVDADVEAFCRRTAESGATVSMNDLAALKQELQEREEADEYCCEC